MNKENDAIQKHLEEQFNQLKPRKEAPEQLKQEVFDTLQLLHLLGDVTDLFTTKFSKTQASFLNFGGEEEE